MATRMSELDYLIKYYPVFWESLTGKPLKGALDGGINNTISHLYHSDKSHQYQDAWIDADIHPFNGTMLYLLTHELPWSEECRVLSAPGKAYGWLDPNQWVMDNYERFRIHLVHDIKPLKQTKVKTETQRGNCMATALAIMTDRTVEDVPALETLGENWHRPFFNWLRDIGYSCTPTKDSSGLLIANGMSPRGIPHSIITVDGGNFHDPHPSSDYLTSVSQYWRITPKPK